MKNSYTISQTLFLKRFLILLSPFSPVSKRLLFYQIALFILVSSCKHEVITPSDYPSLLEGHDGKKITNVKLWEQVQRPYILSLFEQEVYGRIPSVNLPLEFRVSQHDTIIVQEVHAIKKQVELIFFNLAKTDSQVVDLLLYLPAGVSKPVPVFIGLNFGGNQTVTRDTSIFITTGWVRRGREMFKTDETSRGRGASSWPLDLILSKGYGLATMHYQNIEPDHQTIFNSGIRRLFYTPDDTIRGQDEWGAISTWAYGLSSGLNYLETLPEVDKSRIIVIGHSRLGKTALWTGALDQRFAMVVSNNSGCGGAALSRRRALETVEQINTRFPHWFCTNFKKYNENEDALPVDQHMLIGLIAPRPVYIGSAEDDIFADPDSEFLAGYYAGDVYSLYKKKILPPVKPPVDSPYMDGHIGYHVRSGEHAITRYDWEQYIEFANRRLSN